MAKNIFDKLNVLVQARIRSMMRTGGASPRSGNVKKQVTLLRQQLADSLQQESAYQAQIKSLEEEILRWDEQADAAVASGEESTARHAIEQMELAKRRLAFARSDLDSYQRAARELLQKVNQLEAMQDSARQPAQDIEHEQQSVSEAIQSAHQSAQNVSRVDAEPAQQGKTIHVSLTNSERDIKEEDALSVADMDAVVEKDLAARRERLKKPGS